ncbi:MAG TPA: hypothetical protein VKP58_14535 [Candidatus Acidoferrum sp.]|nr:hypothetical protein [Candidatus Acidoferrum sp.]
MKTKILSLGAFAFLLIALPALAQKTLPTPAWKPGESFFYRIHLKIDRDIKTKSALSLPQSPTDAGLDIQAILQVEPLASFTPKNAGAIRLRTWLLPLISDIGILPRGEKPQQSAEGIVQADDKIVDCTLEPTGEIDAIAGLDALAAEQQQAWREWAARFAAPFTLQNEKRKRGDKWTAEEPETIPSPIADLRWQKKSQFVRDEPCAALKFTRAGEFERAANTEPCAAILSTSSLVQKSSPQDATPAEYKQRGLRTRGTAKGANEITLYISRKSGRLVRATQQAAQQMDVFIALADGTTQIHYAVNAKANSTVELIADLPLILQPHPPK